MSADRDRAFAPWFPIVLLLVALTVAYVRRSQIRGRR
jgi:hypothetical protein